MCAVVVYDGRTCVILKVEIDTAPHAACWFCLANPSTDAFRMMLLSPLLVSGEDSTQKFRSQMLRSFELVLASAYYLLCFL